MFAFLVRRHSREKYEAWGDEEIGMCRFGGIISGLGQSTQPVRPVGGTHHLTHTLLTHLSSSLTQQCSSGFSLQQHRHQTTHTIYWRVADLRDCSGSPTTCVLYITCMAPSREPLLGMINSSRDEQATTALAAAEGIRTPYGVWSRKGFVFRWADRRGSAPGTSACNFQPDTQC